MPSNQSFGPVLINKESLVTRRVLTSEGKDSNSQSDSELNQPSSSASGSFSKSSTNSINVDSN